jgi:hypothetical protein
MRNKRLFSTLVTSWFAVSSVILFLSTGLARAQTSSTNYSFVVASGFLCDSGDSGNCLAVAKSANGDSYEICGAGTFDQKNKSVKAAGTFNHKSTNGNVIETGVWTGSDLISFDSYGIAPPALMQKRPVFGRQQISSSKRWPIRLDLLPTGGLAVFRIRLVPMSGVARTAVLQANCALGDVPRERSVEGIRLNIDGDGGEYSEEVGGRVMFLAMRAEISGSAKTPPQETTTDSEKPQSN